MSNNSLHAILAVAAILVALAGGCQRTGALEDADARAASDAGSTLGAYERIKIIGEATNKGAFDPAVEYNEDGSVGWLVYSALESPPGERKLQPQPKLIHTHLAKSTDHGKTWRYVAEINTSAEATVTLKGKKIEGAWWHEVPTLVHDPQDAGREWKLYWMRYFAIPKRYFKFPTPAKGDLIRVIEYMWIACKCAHTPEELASAEETILFDAGQAALAGNKARYNLDAFSPGLKKMKAYAEPGSLYIGGVIYMSLGGFTGPNAEEHKLILLSSSDHGKTWQYVGTLLDHSDAAHFGYKMLCASALAEESDRTFLLVSPIDQKGHHGTYIFEFEDISRGKLKRDGYGHLTVHKYLAPSVPPIAGHEQAGESDYHKHNTYGGIIMPQADIECAPAIAQLFSTKEKIVP